MRSPELLTSVWVQRSLSALRRKDLPLYTYSLALHLDIAAFLLQCCGLFGMECVNWVLGRKQGLKMQFFYLPAIRMNWIVLRSLLFVVCGQMCFYVCYVWCPKSVSFAGCEGGVIFFFVTLLINNLEEGSVPNVAILAAATRKGLNTVNSWVALTILWIVFSLGVDNWLTNLNGEKCGGMRPEAGTAHGDYAVVHMGVWGTICSCCCSVGISFRSHVQITWSVRWFSPIMDLCVSAS